MRLTSHNTSLTYGYATDEAMEEGQRAARHPSRAPSVTGGRVQLEVPVILSRGKKRPDKAQTRCPQNAGGGFDNQPTKQPTHTSTFVAHGRLSIAQRKRMLDVAWIVRGANKNG
jgi:hypothetical protein